MLTKKHAGKLLIRVTSSFATKQINFNKTRQTMSWQDLMRHEKTRRDGTKKMVSWNSCEKKYPSGTHLSWRGATMDRLVLLDSLKIIIFRLVSFVRHGFKKVMLGDSFKTQLSARRWLEKSSWVKLRYLGKPHNLWSSTRWIESIQLIDRIVDWLRSQTIHQPMHHQLIQPIGQFMHRCINCSVDLWIGW